MEPIVIFPESVTVLRVW
jgi:hypothetical protein